jgi:hypothetical protein
MSFFGFPGEGSPFFPFGRTPCPTAVSIVGDAGGECQIQAEK